MVLLNVIALLLTFASVVAGSRGIAKCEDNTEAGFRNCIKLGIYAVLLQIWAISFWILILLPPLYSK